MASPLLLQLTSLPLVPSCLWLVLIFPMFLSLVPSPFQPFLRSLFLRGKLLQPSSSPRRFTVPQSYFLHFYVVGTVVNTVLLFMALHGTCISEKLFLESRMQDAGRIVFLLLLMELQLLRRLYESLYVSKFSGMAQMHVIAYFLGLIYYVLAPLSLFPRAMETISTFPQEVSKPMNSNQCHRSIHSFLKIGGIYWFGGAMFIWGWIHQYRCHQILASLRTNKAQNKEDDHVYRLPYGDWFGYVSSPHYFAEIVMYSSFVIATGGQSLDAWLLFIFVFLNLSIAASDTHTWYRQKFDNYPSSRKAILPFIY